MRYPAIRGMVTFQRVLTLYMLVKLSATASIYGVASDDANTFNMMYGQQPPQQQFLPPGEKWSIMCSCNLPKCVNSDYMCETEKGCFTELIEFRTEDEKKKMNSSPIMGCLDDLPGNKTCEEIFQTTDEFSKETDSSSSNGSNRLITAYSCCNLYDLCNSDRMPKRKHSTESSKTLSTTSTSDGFTESPETPASDSNEEPMTTILTTTTTYTTIADETTVSVGTSNTIIPNTKDTAKIKDNATPFDSTEKDAVAPLYQPLSTPDSEDCPPCSKMWLAFSVVGLFIFLSVLVGVAEVYRCRASNDRRNRRHTYTRRSPNEPRRPRASSRSVNSRPLTPVVRFPHTPNRLTNNKKN